MMPTAPDPPAYRAFTISPSISPHTSKTTWSSPNIKETNLPQSSLIAELSSLQENDKSLIAHKIARLSTDQKAAVCNVLVDLMEEEKDVDEDKEKERRKKLEWSVCEAVRVRDPKRGRTRYVRVFFVGAPVVVKEEVKEKEQAAEECKGKDKDASSTSSGKDKVADESPSKEPTPEKPRRKPTRQREKSKVKGKETEKTEEKKSGRRTTKSRHRKKEPVSDDSDDCSYDEHSDSTISIRSWTMRRQNPRPLSQRFKLRHRETNAAAYGRPEGWEKPVIIPTHFPVRGYPVPPNDYHIRAAYEAGQRDAIAERMRNAPINRPFVPHGPSHVISFERLRPGFEDGFRSDGQIEQEAENYVNQHRPPIVQYPRHVVPDNVPPSSIGTQYDHDSYLQDRHVDRRYMDDIRTGTSYGRYGPNTFPQRYAASELRPW